MDFDKISSGNGKLDILLPGSTKLLGLRLEIVPPDHESLKQYTRQQRDRHRALAQRGRPVMTTDEERFSREMCMIAIVGWEWTVDSDGLPGSYRGEQPEFNREILATFIERDWFRSQVDNFLADDKNFFRA